MSLGPLVKLLGFMMDPWQDFDLQAKSWKKRKAGDEGGSFGFPAVSPQGWITWLPPSFLGVLASYTSCPLGHLLLGVHLALSLHRSPLFYWLILVGVSWSGPPIPASTNSTAMLTAWSLGAVHLPYLKRSTWPLWEHDSHHVSRNEPKQEGTNPKVTGQHTQHIGRKFTQC